MGRVRRAYASVGDSQLHYRYAGSPDRPVLVLLHQSPSHSAMYEALMAELDGDFFLLAPDLPGFGNSDPLPLDEPEVADYCAVLQTWLASLEIDSYGVFGHHMGAALAACLARLDSDKVSAVALSGPTLMDDAMRESLPGRAAPFRPAESGEHLIGMWQRMRGKDGGAPLSLSLRETLSALAAGEQYPTSYRAVAAQDYAADLAALQQPTLVFAGERDILAAAVEPTLALLQNGTRGELAGGEGGYLCELQAQQIAAMLRNHFRR